MFNQALKEENRIREKLEDLLETEESLKGYTKGYMGPGGAGMTALFGFIGEAVASLFRQWYYVGLTEKRLLLIPTAQQGETATYPLAEVISLTYERKGGWLSSTTIPGILRIRVHRETLEIKAKGKRWWQYAEDMVAVFKRMEPT